MKARFLLGTAALTGTAVLVGQLSAAHDGRQPTSPLGGGNGNLMNPSGEDIYDVAICQLSSLSQFGKIGTFPNGTVGLAFSTTGLNVNNGTNSKQLPWFVSPSVHHPVIGMNLYRVNGEGRLEQVGMSWLKHAWFAVQGTSCGSCNSSGTGSILGIGCADTYGGSLNADRFWLGPRWEINPIENIWMDGVTWSGSHFARNSNNGDSSAHGPVEHLLRVRMSDLVTPDSTYYYEGFYHLNKRVGDATWGQVRETPNRYKNNIAHRRTIPNHNGNGNFSFGSSGPTHTYGPVTDVWGDTQSTASPIDDGALYVSSRVVQDGPNYRYEYAVHNFNVHREVKNFSVPLPPGATVSNIGFHAVRDGYWDAGGNFVNEAPMYDISDWEANVSGTEISYNAPTPQGETFPNTLRYGMTYTFWFTVNASPADGAIAMEPYKTGGTVNQFSATARVPGELGTQIVLMEAEVMAGQLLFGGVPQLIASDNDRLRIRSTPGFNILEPDITELKVSGTSPLLSPSLMSLTVEGKTDHPNGVEKVRLFNYSTNQFDSLGEFARSNVDTTFVINSIPNPGDYIRDADGNVELRLRTVVPAVFSANGFIDFHDLIEFSTQE